MLKIENHIKEHQLNIYKLVKGKILIYLDTKYWLILRDQKNETEPSKRILLDKVIELADSGKCLFPISEITFWEFFKQGNFKTLKETSILVDRLSNGISMINADQRRVLEFTHFLYKKTGRDTFEMDELIWTKLPLIFGYDFIAKLETEKLQKSFFDFVINSSLLDIIKTIYNDGVIKKPFYFKDDIKLLNDMKKKHASENRSLKQMFLSELEGYLDLYQEVFRDVIIDVFHKENKKEHSLIEKSSADKNNSFKHIIYNGFKLNKLTTELPIFRIVPELFALARWNRDRKFSDGNDTLDFLHASFALPYCDYFFTERELKTMIVQTKLDELYSCYVESKENLILEILNKI